MCAVGEDYVTTEDKYYCVTANQQGHANGGGTSKYLLYGL
jgi:hypothetical protein